MNPVNPGPGMSNESDLEALQSQQNMLQMMVLATLVGLCILCAGVGAFIFKQLRLVQQNLAEQRPNVQRLVAEYQEKSEPLVRNFSTAMAQFAATNQSFQPILDRYRPILSNYMVVPRPGSVPAPPAP